MKKAILILILIVTTLTVALIACCFRTKTAQIQETNPSTDTWQSKQIHPVIKNIFYNLPLEKSRLDLREIIVNDKRFILTDTAFNNYKPSLFFKGITTDKGLIKSNPDSIQVMLIYGNAALVTEKGGEEDFTKHPMIFECKYYFSNKGIAELEYR